MTLVPLAEHFHSFQGEGLFTGLPMHFLRFPGCTVGRTFQAGKAAETRETRETPVPILGELTDDRVPKLILYSDAEAKRCAAFDGQEFWCDTDYSKHEEFSVEQLVDETHESVVCFTGGEPLMHQHQLWFKELYQQLRHADKEIHIETSGTIVPKLEFDCLTISPKQGWKASAVLLATQLKFLVTDQTQTSEIEDVAQHSREDCQIWLSPIFDPNELVRVNLDRAFELLKARPDWRLNLQVHKFIGAR